MAYSPTTWVEAVTKVGPTNLNKIETALTKMPYGPDASASQVAVGDGAAGWTMTNFRLSSLTDMTIGSPARGDRLYWDSVSSTWKNLAADVVSARVYGSVGDSIRVTALGINLLDSATINVNSSPITAGFATSGTAYLSGVAFTYTGLTSSSFTGCGSHAATLGGELVQYIGTNNTTTIAAAITAAGTGPVLFPNGYHRTTVAASTLSGPFMGPGQVITTESGPAYNARGKVFNQLTSQPANPSVVTGSFSPFQYGALTSAFNGDLTHVSHVIEHRVSGADTLGTIPQTTGLVVNGVNALDSGTINVFGNPIAAGFTNGAATAYLNGVAFTYTGLTSSSFTGCGSHAATTGGERIRSISQASGYAQIPEAAPFIGYLNSTSGRSIGGTGRGRTGLGFFQLKVTADTGSGGDYAALWADLKAIGTSVGTAITVNGVNALNSGTINVNSSPITAGYPDPGGNYTNTAYLAGAAFTYTGLTSSSFTGCGTHAATTGGETISSRWDQGTSVGMVAGSVIAGNSGVYLDPDEIQVNGATYDCTAIGLVRNMTRNVADTSNLGTFWQGTRITSSGTQALDVGHQLIGVTSGQGFMVGVDMTSANLTTSGTYQNAAFTLAAAQRIYLNAVAGPDTSALGFNRRPSSTGTDYITYAANSGGHVDTFVGGINALQVYSNQVGMAGALTLGGGLNMGTHKITSMVAGALSTDGATLGNSLSDFAVPSANVAMNSKKLTGLAAPTAAGDAVRYEQLFGAPSSAMGSLMFPGVVDVQVFGPTAGATWTRPGSGSHVIIIAIGPGGGGGGGVAGAVSLYGGSGGGAGDAAVAYLPFAALPGSVTVQVGGGGAGGAGSATTTGTAGSAGSRSTIFDTSNNTVVAPAGGGGGGGGTSIGAAGAAASAATFTTYSGYTIASVDNAAGGGGQSSITTNAGAGGTAGGGAGAGITSGGAVAGNGGTSAASALAFAAAASASTAGAAGAVMGNTTGAFGSDKRYAGGGGAAITGASTAGAGGAGYTGGGGGGGGSSRSGTGGAGAAGGDGRLVVIVLA